jgi:leucyl aminopeptidase
MFKCSVSKASLQAIRGDVLVLSLFENEGISDPLIKEIDSRLKGWIRQLLKNKEFRGKAHECEWIPVPTGLGIRRILLVGLGSKKKFWIDTARRVAGTAAREITRKRFKKVTTLLHGANGIGVSSKALAQAVVEGTAIGEYQFEIYKTEETNNRRTKIQSLNLLAPKGESLSTLKTHAQKGLILAECQNQARDIINTPANEITPKRLAEIAREEARRWGLKVRIFGLPEIKRLRMGGLINVGRGSENPPYFVVLEHAGRKRNEAPVVIVGKGITFDSGGLSLKPSNSMETMKYDKAGAVATLYSLVAAARLKISQRAIGLMAIAENLPSGKAYKPGDVVRTMSGKTIEVLNTDAEGRVVLSDALSYAERYNPKAVIDIATLTGACVIALGYDAIGMMGREKDSNEIKAALKKAGEFTGERVWELPLWDEYYDAIKSSIADIKNVGNRAAGTITAAAFLGHFTEKYPWVHLDIAGTGWNEESKPYLSKGPTGAGVRLLTQYLLDLS